MSEVTVCTAAVDDGAADDSGADDAGAADDEGAADDDAAEDDDGGAAVLVSLEQAAGNPLTATSRANVLNMMPPRPWTTLERTERQHVESCKDACPSAEALWHHLDQAEAGHPAISGASRYHVWVVNGSVIESPRCKTRKRRFPRVDTPALSVHCDEGSIARQWTVSGGRGLPRASETISSRSANQR